MIFFFLSNFTFQNKQQISKTELKLFVKQNDCRNINSFNFSKVNLARASILRSKFEQGLREVFNCKEGKERRKFIQLLDTGKKRQEWKNLKEKTFNFY